MELQAPARLTDAQRQWLETAPVAFRLIWIAADTASGNAQQQGAAHGLRLAVPDGMITAVM